MILPWLATWGALALACILAVVVVFLGVQVVRLSHRVDELRACRLPVETTFGLYLGRCVRRDDHEPGKCAHE